MDNSDIVRGMRTMKVNPSPPKKILPPTSARPLRPKNPSPVREEKISIRANHYQVEINEKTFPATIYHYDVVIRNEDLPPRDAAHAKEMEKRKAMQAKKAEKEGKEAAGLPDRMLPAIWKEFQRQYHTTLKYAAPFDGKKNAYSAKRLELGNGDAFKVLMNMVDPDDPGKKRKFRVEIKLVAEVDTAAVHEFMQSGMSFGKAVVQPQDVIQGLDVALRHAPTAAYISCNRSFFNAQSTKHYNLDNLLELLHGHYQSLCLGAGNSATLNIDLATKAFYKEMPLVEYVRLICGVGPKESLALKHWRAEDIERATEGLKGKLIKYGTGPQDPKTGDYKNYHKFTAVGLVKESAAGYKFNLDPKSDVMINIVQYMAKKDTTILQTDWPVVHIGNKNMTNYVPLELCTIITQPYKGKMEPKLTAAMIKGAAIAPMERFDSIDQARQRCRFEACKVMAEFGLKVGDKPINIDSAYRIQPPKIMTKGKGDTKMHATEGKWTFGGGNQGEQRQFIKPAIVPRWMILDCHGVPEDVLLGFKNCLAQTGKALGMTGFDNFVIAKRLFDFGGIAPPRMANERRPEFGFRFESPSVTSTRLKSALAQAKSKGVELVIVIMRQEGKEYPLIKAEAEVRVGILTACIRAENVVKYQSKPQTMTNYLLKLNAKLNGSNFTVGPLTDTYFKEPTMILGADVTHPAPNSTSPSIAAVTASFNMSGMGYTMHIQPQESRQELIVNMAEIVEKNLKEFHQVTGKLPRRLLMFRDGVSEGYFDEVKSIEYEDMKRTCDRIAEKFGLKEGINITFVIVKKRHHTRFQPNIQKQGVGKLFNVPPGTVVDSKIVHPSEIEFFLNSHVGIQGTSKPTRYHVIHDDNKYTMGDLMRITYFLCYGFVRCTAPVSYPAATYYAHLAAYRARHLLEKEGENASLEALIKQLTIHPDLKKYPMFFV